MIRGKGRFRTRCEVDGRLEISASDSGRDARLWEWIQEASVVLPMLQSMVKGRERAPGVRAVLGALEDLAHRVEKLEAEVLRLGNERPR